MVKHTPGPWVWDGTFPITIYDADGYHVVGSYGMMPSGAANARLIAAAPDLLHACNDLLALGYAFAGMQGHTHGLKLGEVRPEHRKILDAARAAIAKAEGEAPEEKP